MSKIIFTEEASKPPAPSVGQVSLYVKTDEIVYIQDSAGTEIPLGSAASITALTGDVTGTGPGSTVTTIEAIQGTAVTGTTGTGNVVFSASPTLTGTLNGVSAIFSSTITASNLSGSNSGDVTLLNSNSIDLSFSSGQSNLQANLNLSSAAADASNLRATYSIKSDGLFIEYAYGTPVQIGTSNAVGAASGFALYDHVHAHGNQTVATLHAIATDIANGFMSATDKTKLDAATALNTPSTLVIRDGSGNFAANVITANLTGIASGNLIPVTNFVIVQQNPGDGEFSSIATAIASITTASSTNPFVVWIGPGVYTEAQIIMQPYVYVTGASFDSVVIKPSNPAAHLIIGCDYSSISSCTLTGVTGSGQALVYHNSATGTEQTAFWIKDVRLGASDTLVIAEGNATGVSAVFINSCRFGSTYSFNTGFYATSSSTNPGRIIANYLTTTSMQSPYPADVFLADQAGCEIFLNGSQIKSGTTTSGNCIRVRNGALARILSSEFVGFGIALFSENVGSGPVIEVTEGLFLNNTADLNIANSATTGIIIAAATLTNSTIVSGLSGLALVILDTVTGAINTSNMINIEQADGTFTDATTLGLVSSPMGVMKGGAITVVSGLTVNVASGYGYLDTVGSSLTTGSIHRLNWSSTNITLAANSNNYLYWNSSATLSASSSLPDTAGNILLGRVITNGTGIDFIDSSPLITHHYGNSNDNFIRNALGSVFAYGCQVTENATPLELNVTSGSYYFGNNNFTPSSGSAITFQTFYQDGSGGWIIGSSNTVDTSNYDNGSGTLQPIPSGHYTRHTLYLVGQGAAQQYLFVYGQTVYSSLVLAQTGNIPTPPAYFTDGVVLLASIIVLQGSSSIIAGGGQIVDNRPRIGFSTPAVSAVGTVTSVALSLPGSVFTVSGSPITSSGTLTGNFQTQSANIVFAGPSSGSAAIPTFRGLVSADIPAINLAATGNGGITGILPNSNTTATSSNVINTIVERDGSGNFSAGTITATLNGNASTATFATTSTTSTNFTGSLSGDVTGTQSATSVVAIQGSSVSSTTPTDAQLLIYNSGTSKWTPESLSGDINIANTGAATIQSNVVSNSKLAQMPTMTLKGNNTGSTANAADLTVSQITTMLGDIVSIGSFDSQTPQANGLDIATNVLYAQSASATVPGMVNNTTQSFSGNKTFTGQVAITIANTSALAINTSSFIFDSTNNALGIGLQPSTSVMIDGLNTSGSSKLVQMTGYGVGSTTGYRGRFARGTVGSPTAVQTGDILSAISGRGYGASQFAAASTGVINIIAGENFTNTSNLTYLQFSTTPTGSVTSAESMRVASTGVTLGPQSGSTAIHQVNGGVNVSTRTTTTSLTVDTTTADYLILCNNSGAITITLPSPTNGRTLIIKDIAGTANTNNITIARHASESIEGLAANFIFQTNWGSLVLFSDGTNWYIQ